MSVVKPLYDRVMIEKIEQEKKTAGGIIIPDNAQEKPTRGRVVAVGAGQIDKEGKRVPMAVNEGDVVLFAKWGGSEFSVDGKEYLILKESDLLAVIS
jgi:chaperonin GroES